MRERGETRTRPDAPEIVPDEAFWRNARVVVPPGKTSFTCASMPMSWLGSGRRAGATSPA